jgi:hypothetical protein
MDAVASAMPSMIPTESALAPATVTKKAGSSPWIISDERSINMLTNPKAMTPLGTPRNASRAIARPSRTLP